jgi:plasmid stabilization system protein ParE
MEQSSDVRRAANPEESPLGHALPIWPDRTRGIRRVPISRFPKHLVFDSVEDSDVLILRVLHGARDLEGLF